MKRIQQFAISSIIDYKPLIKERMEIYSKKRLFRHTYLQISKRTPERITILNDMDIYLKNILEILKSPNYKKLLLEYAEEDIKKRKVILKNVKISESELKDFKEKLNKIISLIKRIPDIYPLSVYLSFILKLYPKMIEIDYQLFEKLKRKDYLSLVEDSFERFPEKIILFHAPLIALYIAFGGYERMNLLQLTRLTKIFHMFANLLVPLEEKSFAVIEAGKEIEKIPVLAKR